MAKYVYIVIQKSEHQKSNVQRCLATARIERRAPAARANMWSAALLRKYMASIRPTLPTPGVVWPGVCVRGRPARILPCHDGDWPAKEQIWWFDVLHMRIVRDLVGSSVTHDCLHPGHDCDRTQLPSEEMNQPEVVLVCCLPWIRPVVIRHYKHEAY